MLFSDRRISAFHLIKAQNPPVSTIAYFQGNSSLFFKKTGEANNPGNNKGAAATEVQQPLIFYSGIFRNESRIVLLEVGTGVIVVAQACAIVALGGVQEAVAPVCAETGNGFAARMTVKGNIVEFEAVAVFKVVSVYSSICLLARCRSEGDDFPLPVVEAETVGAVGVTAAACRNSISRDDRTAAGLESGNCNTFYTTGSC